MNIDLINQRAEPGDIILIGGDSLMSKIIQYAQKVQTKDGNPSLYSHSMMYVNPQCVAESTIDFKPYGSTKKRLDNGAQYSNIYNYAHTSRALLLHFPFNKLERIRLLDRADAIISVGATYPILGLIGSLLSYYVFHWESNPLQSKRSLYCSAFLQEIYNVLKVRFDRNHTARNTSVEIISQYEYAGLVKIPA